MPLKIELPLVDSASVPRISSTLAYDPIAISGIQINVLFTAMNQFIQLSVLNVQAKCYVISLNSGLSASYVRLLANGKDSSL